MASLYNIAGDFNKLQSENLPAEMIAETLEGIAGEFDLKVEATLAVIKNLNSDAEALKTESQSLLSRSKAAANKVESLKKYIAENMKAIGVDTLSAGVHTVTIRKPVQKLEVLDPSKLDLSLVDIDTVIKPKTNDIKAKLKAGEIIEGATLVTGKESILVK